MSKNIGIISQVRMTSSRLPGKVMKEANGIPMLYYHIERLKWSKFPIIIATTVNKTDDCIVDFAIQYGINYYRGSEDNVLSRYYECAKENNLDVVIRVTSDCPLIDGYLLGKGINEFLLLEDENAYVSNCLNRTFPVGFDFEIFSFNSLREAYEKSNTKYENEHVTPYIQENKSGKIKFHSIVNNINKSRYRVTLDTREDYILIKELIVKFHAHELTYEKIISILDTYSDLVKINAHIQQKTV